MYDADHPAKTAVPWLNKHASKLHSLNGHAGDVFVQPQPFMVQLSSLTRLKLYCAQISPESLTTMAQSLKVNSSSTAQHSMHVPVDAAQHQHGDPSTPALNLDVRPAGVAGSPIPRVQLHEHGGLWGAA